jgi:acetyl esterase/lipase
MIKNLKYFLFLNLIFIAFLIFACKNIVKYEYPQADWSDVDYSGNNHISQKMDIYLPKNNREKHPAVIVVYGSGWSSNNKKLSNYQKDVFVKPLIKKGFATISINHRSSNLDSVYPAQIHDVKAVIRFLRAKHKDYNLDTSFIGIAGYSSGGHLAALAGTSSNISSLEGNVGNYLEFDSNVHAVVDFYGPTDLSVFYDCPITKDRILTSEQKKRVFGDVDNISNIFDLANPIRYISKETPPFLIFHGEMDRTVPVCQSQLLHNALKKNNIYSQLILKPDGDHCGNTLMFHHSKKMAEFFYDQYNNQL